MSADALGLFQGFGVELEYMIVDSETQTAKPVADRLLEVGGRYESEVEHGQFSWSNELVLHVIEIKTNGPAPSLQGLAAGFQDQIRQIGSRLAPLNAKLMPTGMHPTMDPFRETVLWPHEHNEVYEGFNRIFDCSGHGWANLQSVHLNLPFAGDEEFSRLHAAIRLILPIIPALAASSPLADGSVKSWLDTRMETYRLNAASMPSISGLVIPELVSSRSEYQRRILDPIYADLAPHDPRGVLQHEWANARGAIARFDRNTIEIRVIDVQECPIADLAITAAIVSALRSIVFEEGTRLQVEQQLKTEQLAEILLDVIRHGDSAVIQDQTYLSRLGVESSGPITAGEVWRLLVDQCKSNGEDLSEWEESLEILLTEGCLARRVLSRLGSEPTPRSIRATYDALCECLVDGSMFRAWV